MYSADASISMCSTNLRPRHGGLARKPCWRARTNFEKPLSSRRTTVSGMSRSRPSDALPPNPRRRCRHSRRRHHLLHLPHLPPRPRRLRHPPPHHSRRLYRQRHLRLCPQGGGLRAVLPSPLRNSAHWKPLIARRTTRSSQRRCRFVWRPFAPAARRGVWSLITQSTCRTRRSARKQNRSARRIWLP